MKIQKVNLNAAARGAGAIRRKSEPAGVDLIGASRQYDPVTCVRQVEMRRPTYNERPTSVQ